MLVGFCVNECLRSLVSSEILRSSMIMAGAQNAFFATAPSCLLAWNDSDFGRNFLSDPQYCTRMTRMENQDTDTHHSLTYEPQNPSLY